MGQSGYVDWHRLRRSGHLVNTQLGSTFVYAFWFTDYGRSTSDRGVSLLKADNDHPDWFLSAPRADQLLLAVTDDVMYPSPNSAELFDHVNQSRPLLGSLLLGTAAAAFATADAGEYWWCERKDLTRTGRKLLSQVSTLYLRQPVIVTFLDQRPMKKPDPGTTRDTATVPVVPGPSTP